MDLSKEFWSPRYLECSPGKKTRALDEHALLASKTLSPFGRAWLKGLQKYRNIKGTENLHITSAQYMISKLIQGRL